MANKKITELDAVTTLASTDVVPVVDVSADTTNKITASNLFRTLPDGTAASPSLSFASDAANGVFLAGTDTVGISTGGTQRVTVDGSGNVTISGDLTVSGATTTVESTTVTIDDKNIELGSVATPTDTTADGGGITLKGATDKEIKWVNSTGYWTFNTGIEVGGHLQIDDSNEIRVGTGQDLKIYHDGSNSYLSNNTGDLRIAQTLDDGDIFLQADDGSGGLANYIFCDGSSGRVVLSHYGSGKLETKSNGVDITGELQVSSGTTDVVADFASSDANAWIQIRDNSTTDTAVMVGAVGDDLRFRAGSNERARIDSSGRLLVGSSSSIESNSVIQAVSASNSTVIIGNTNTSASGEAVLNLAPSNSLTGAQIKCIAEEDFSTVANRSASLEFRTRKDGTFNEAMLIDSSGRVGVGTSSPSMQDGNANPVVHLYHATSPVEFRAQRGNGCDAFFTARSAELEIGTNTNHPILFRTNDAEVARFGSSGRLLLGTTTEGHGNADNLTIADSGDCGLTIRSGTSNYGSIYFSDATSGAGETRGQLEYNHSNDALLIYTAGTERLRITSTGAFAIEGSSNYGTSGQVLTSNGNDAPTWQDAGAASVGGATAISMNDNVKINFGASDDLQIFHDGTDTFVRNNQGDLILQTISPGDDVILRAHDDVIIQTGGSDNAIICDNDGAVKLYYNTALKFATTTDGATMYGTLGFGDNDKIEMGQSSDLRIYHDGSNSFIQDAGSGDLYIRASNNLFLQNAGGTETYLSCNENGAVNLNYDNSGKLQTKTDGVNIIGELECDSLDVDGAGDFTGDVTFRGGTGAVLIAGNSDIRFETGSWTGESTKIQHHGTVLYIQGSSNGIQFRHVNGSDRCHIDANGHFLPNTNNTYDLGNSSLRWRNLYTNDLNLSNEGSTNDVDGTWGNYTIQEGEDDLFLINRRNGKKYKFNLTEVS